MKMTFYPKMAWMGIRKNSRMYVPYLLTCAGMIAMYYICLLYTSVLQYHCNKKRDQLQGVTENGSWYGICNIK